MKTPLNQMLLIRIGAIGVFGGFFGSLYSQLSCRFAVSSLSAGFYQSEFKTYAGLWKYSSITNAFSDYSSCSAYGGRYSITAPYTSRNFGILSFVTGLFALMILWRFLFFAKTTSVVWRVGVKLAVVSGVAQLLTLILFFSEGYCRQNNCKVGPGSIFAIIAATSWFSIAYFMHHNAPILDMTVYNGNRSFIRKIIDFFELSLICRYFCLFQSAKEDKAVSNMKSIGINGQVSTARPPSNYTVMV